MIRAKSYPGSKTNTGIIQFLCNNMPFHLRYREYFAGTAQLYLHKLPALDGSFLADLNKDVVNHLNKTLPPAPGMFVYNADALDLLQLESYTREDFIYLDPPYPEVARRSGAKYYKHEMLKKSDHLKLLRTVRALDANIMISSKPNQLYSQVLHDWRTATFKTADRVGPYDEVIYMNYDTPPLLHQYNHLGTDCWDRQRIKRKIQSFSKKIGSLPLHEKHLFIQEMIKNDTAAVQHFLAVLEQ